jgi:hypothetical protein
VPPRRANGRGRGTESLNSRRTGTLARQRGSSPPRAVLPEPPTTGGTDEHDSHSRRDDPRGCRARRLAPRALRRPDLDDPRTPGPPTTRAPSQAADAGTHRRRRSGYVSRPTASRCGALPLRGAASCGMPAAWSCLSLHSIKRGARRERSLSRSSSGSARRWPMCSRRRRRSSMGTIHLMAGSRWRIGCGRQRGVLAQPPTASGSGVSPPTIARTSTTTRCRATRCWATRSVLAVASVVAGAATRISGETASEAG